MRRLRAVRRRLAGDGGYSLTELLVVLAILGTVLGGITTIFVSGSKAELDMNKRFQAQQNARLALSRLRVDIHVAACATVGTSPTPSLALFSTSDCSGAALVTWCTASTQSGTRWGLYRATGGTCSSTVGIPIADYLLTTGLPFVISRPAAGSKQRPSVAISLPVDVAKTTGTGLYTLQDAIVLRNAPPA